MGFLNDLATHLKTAFAKINHNHDTVYEAKNSNIQTHISNTSNPHGVTKSQIGLGNVTNDAQIKKSATSTQGKVPKWANNNGDSLDDGYSVETVLSGSSNVLCDSSGIMTYVDNAVTGISSSGLIGAVQDVTALKAINTTNADDYPDKVLIPVEDSGLYRLDRESIETADDNRIVQPTTGLGRWFKMSSSINDHNLLSNIQGGATGEKYHVSANTDSALAGTNGTPSGANKFVTATDTKLSKLNSDGTLNADNIDVSAAQWTSFDNSLNA